MFSINIGPALEQALQSNVGRITTTAGNVEFPVPVKQQGRKAYAGHAERILRESGKAPARNAEREQKTSREHAMALAEDLARQRQSAYRRVQGGSARIVPDDGWRLGNPLPEPQPDPELEQMIAGLRQETATARQVMLRAQQTYRERLDEARRLVHRGKAYRQEAKVALESASVAEQELVLATEEHGRLARQLQHLQSL